ncbi:pentatricopeptide repeat-containing protein At2g34400-like [Wolffia australiana]
MPRLPPSSTYAWNLAIAALWKNNAHGEAFTLYNLMRKNDIKADSHSLSFLAKVCVSNDQISQAHCQSLKLGFSSEVIVQTSLLCAYASVGELDHAQELFDETPHRDLPFWNAILAANSRLGCPLKTLELARAMARAGRRPNAVTATTILSACSALRDLRTGKLVHGAVLRNLLGLDTPLRSALLGVYARCGAIDIARQLFDEMPSRDTAAWTAMISQYSENNRAGEALALFKDMMEVGVAADEGAILAAANAAGLLHDREVAEFVGGCACRQGIGGAIRVANALMLMRARCGDVDGACEIFGGMAERTAVSWTTMIQVLGMHGRGEELLVRFCQMRMAGVAPDEVCFVGVLSGCNRAGMVAAARQCFREMEDEHGLRPWIEHCSSMVDLLCREGLLEEAVGFMEGMPMRPDERMKKVFVRACERWRRPELAVFASEKLFGCRSPASTSLILVNS